MSCFRLKQNGWQPRERCFKNFQVVSKRGEKGYMQKQSSLLLCFQVESRGWCHCVSFLHYVNSGSSRNEFPHFIWSMADKHKLVVLQPWCWWLFCMISQEAQKCPFRCPNHLAVVFSITHKQIEQLGRLGMIVFIEHSCLPGSVWISLSLLMTSATTSIVSEWHLHNEWHLLMNVLPRLIFCKAFSNTVTFLLHSVFYIDYHVLS